jgi:lysine 2,3-aminomutase
MSQKTLRSPAELASTGLVSADRLPELDRVARRYAVAITPEMADLIDPHDPDDPIARQFVLRTEELAHAPEESVDPIGDAVHSPVEGIVHRYPDRVLLKPLHACAVYCRFCFRREMVGPTGLRALSPKALSTALAYIAGRREIWEVIVTGGDPLVLSVRRLHRLVRRLGAIEHVKIIRFHTRVPLVDPGRVTKPLVEALKAPGPTTYVAVHANHPREFTPAGRSALARLADGIPLLGQSVLLRGVNDDPETLGHLMRAFVENRVKPYYLHHGDLAPGTAHLRTTIAEGQDLMRALRGRLSGLCQPTYVLDIPGGHGKTPIGPCDAHAGDTTDSEGKSYRIVDYRGGEHRYPPEPNR